MATPHPHHSKDGDDNKKQKKRYTRPKQAKSNFEKLVSKKRRIDKQNEEHKTRLINEIKSIMTKPIDLEALIHNTSAPNPYSNRTITNLQPHSSSIQQQQQQPGFTETQQSIVTYLHELKRLRSPTIMYSSPSSTAKYYYEDDELQRINYRNKNNDTISTTMSSSTTNNNDMDISSSSSSSYQRIFPSSGMINDDGSMSYISNGNEMDMMPSSTPYSYHYGHERKNDRYVCIEPRIKLWDYQEETVDFMKRREEDAEGLGCYGGIVSLFLFL